MLEQFSREHLQLYPAAKILVANKDDVSPAQELPFTCMFGDEPDPDGRLAGDTGVAH